MLAAIMDAQAGQCPEERQEAQAGREDRAEGRDCGTQENSISHLSRSCAFSVLGLRETKTAMMTAGCC